MLENLFNYATSFAASPMEMRQKPGTQFVFLTQPHCLFCRHNLNFELLMSRSGPKERLIMVRSCNLCQRIMHDQIFGTPGIWRSPRRKEWTQTREKSSTYLFLCKLLLTFFYFILFYFKC